MSQPLDFEHTLAEYGPFLQRLASALIRDRHGAEDLVQEVYAEALAAKPSGLLNAKAWLARVLRNRAANRRRQWQPSTLEAAGEAAHVTAADPHSIAVRLESERLLHGALEALREPYRTALILRYRSELPVREIARSMGTTVAAATSHLQRGRALLREQLAGRFADAEDSQGAWLGALALLAPVERPARALAASAGVGVMSPPLLVAVFLCALIAVGLWFVLRAPQAGQGAESSALVARLEAPSAAFLEAPEPPEARTGVPAQDARERSASESRAPTAVGVAVTVGRFGADGRPFVRFPILLRRAEPGTSPGAIRWVLTGEDGYATFEGLEPGPYESRDLTHDRWFAFSAVEGDADQHQSAQHSAPFTVRGVVRTAAGEPAAGATLWLVGHEQMRPIAIPVTRSAENGEFEVYECQNNQLFATREDVVPSAPTMLSGLPLIERGVFRCDLQLGGDGTTVAGQVVERSGVPVGGAEIALTWGGVERAHSTAPQLALVTDGQGTFRVPCRVPAGTARIEVVAAGHGLVRRSFELGPREERLELVLPAERIVRGRALDSSGEPVIGARISAVLSDEQWDVARARPQGTVGPRPRATTDASGAFTLRGLGDEPLELFAERQVDGAEALIGQASVRARAGADAVDIVLRSLHLLSGRISDPSGAPVARLQVRGCHPRTGESIAVTIVDAEGRFELSGRAGQPEARRLGEGDQLRIEVEQLVDVGPLQAPVRLLHATFEGLTPGTRDLVLTVPCLPPATATIRGRVTARDPALLDSVTLGLRSADRTCQDPREFDRGSGRFEIGPLPAGSYVAEVRRAAIHVLISRSQIEVAAGETVDIGDLEVGSGGPVALVVGDSIAATLGRTYFSLHGRSSQTVYVFGDGPVWRTEYAVEPGTWRVRLHCATHTLEEFDVVVEEGRETRVEVTLLPKGSGDGTSRPGRAR